MTDVMATDLFEGFWQVSLDPACKEYFALITDMGCYTPEWVMMGMTDA
jgi:hypothetical protein